MGADQGARVWEEAVRIPTYRIGQPNKNPMFLEKRVYQGSSGKVYPYPVIDKIYDEKEDKEYKAVYLENKYLKVMILPELGGRIQRAYDKTNDYDFVYYNHVIKPALVGLLGPWISGGIEFNWPQHHRPTTYMPTDYMMMNGRDGSVSVLVNDVDRMYGTKSITKFTLYEDKAYIEITGQLYNRTNMPQTFLWWANPAVPVNENTQSVFPPDVHAVMDHGKRDVSRFPIATGVYYKHDYSEGVDISRYKNIPVPTSYMAEKSEFNFVGGYDYGMEAGILHVADHHVSPGKKQWTWGCGDFGKAWDRNLTETDGPYIELMTGVYTDNQPDFTWLKPFEEKVFQQYFMPYKAVGAVKNASIDAVVNLEIEENEAKIIVYTTAEQKDVRITVSRGAKIVFEDIVCTSPEKTYTNAVMLEGGENTEYTLRVTNKDGRELVAYTPLADEIPRLPEPARAAKKPEEIMNNEELYLTAQHIEQYRHATYLPDPYYLEGLKRDEKDSRLNTGYGSLLLTRGLFAESEAYFRKAIKRLTWKNPNPYDSEAYYKLGLSLYYQKRYEEAYDAFYKATWTNEQQEMSFYYLAAIACMKGDYETALSHAERGLVKNWHNVKARGLKAIILRKLNRCAEAGAWIEENLRIDPFDYLSRREQIYGMMPEEAETSKQELYKLMRDSEENYLQTARDYADGGFYEEAIQTLSEFHGQGALHHYYKAYYSRLHTGDDTAAARLYQEAEQADSFYCFPNRLEDIAVLKDCMDILQGASFAPYYLGNLYYDKKQYEAAVQCWEQSAGNRADFPTVWRNLSLAYYNHMEKPLSARSAIEKAFELDDTDSRVFLEMDQLYKKLRVTPDERLTYYEKHKETALERDDSYLEYVMLKNTVGAHKEAYELLCIRNLHPWEGGEGKAPAQYTLALLELAKKALSEKQYQEAEQLLQQALVYPENLGEGKLEGSKDNHIHYYLGIVYEAMGEEEKAKEQYRLASTGSNEVAGMMYYNDQPADMILYQGLALHRLGEKAAGNARLYKLIDFGEQHMEDKVTIDYFAVSLPDLMIYQEDFCMKNKAHCYYIIGLGRLGLGDRDKAREAFEQTLELDPSHTNCRILLKQI